MLYRSIILNNIKHYNPRKAPKMLVTFGNMIAHMLSNKRCNSIVSELFIRERKLNISLVLIIQYYFYVPKHIILNSTHSFIKEILNKIEPQQIEFHH